MSLFYSIECIEYRVHGLIGGADRTFACKSQECLWQDWYILTEIWHKIRSLLFRKVIFCCGFSPVQIIGGRVGQVTF